jgi:erythromycin esterase-like protein
MYRIIPPTGIAMIRSASAGKCATAMACLLLAMATCCWATEKNDEAARRWLRENVIPLQTVEAGHGFADLQPLSKIVKDARIVELGEATHGTREFFQLKHRMVEYLASQKGFTIFSIEANMPEAYRLNDFVLKGDGDPKELLKGMYFWTWNTEEVLEMILWMREFNKSGKGRIEFTGFDMQTPTMSLAEVRKFLQERDGAYLFATVNPLYKDVAGLDHATGQNFGFATTTLPVKAAAGKHVTVSGYLRGEAITEGYAGLWIRSDGVHAFSDMHDAGVKGTTPWTRYEISIDVPAGATNISFGAVLSGNGTAWVDSLAITIDGVPYVSDKGDEKGFDPGFESATPRGFHTGGDGYEIALDNSIAEDGKQSLRMKRVGVPVPVLAGRCADVVAHLEKNRADYIQNGVAVKDVDWVIQNARLVLQYAQLKAGSKTRDESMADNVKWIADQNPDAKIIVWAHNGHVSNTGFSGTRAMGSYLRAMFGKQIVNFGFAFNEGSFRAFEMGKTVHEFTVEPAPEGSLDRALASLNVPIFAIDLRQVPKMGPVAEWFAEEHASRSIGSGYGDKLAPYLWNKNPANQDFDALFFVEKTTAARGNP